MPLDAVKVVIRKYVDDAQPGFVECCLVDASGREWLFIEKVPVVTESNLDGDSAYPQPGCIACVVVARRRDETGREIASVSTETPWDVAATTGETSFEVLADQLATIA
jgi:hypothetical protein